MAGPENSQAQKDHEHDESNQVSLDTLSVAALAGMLLITLGIGVWTSFKLNSTGESLRETKSDFGVFVAGVGWKIGEFAPDVLVTSLTGTPESFRSVAEEHQVIYIASDTCTACIRQFPELNRASQDIGRAGGSFAVVSVLNQSSLTDLRDQHQFIFPVYSINKDNLSHLNLYGSPTVLVFRRGVLIDAFSEPSVEALVSHAVKSLKR